MQSRKTPCLYHPDQSITNFCRDKSCLMPLCPSCIRDHSLYHEQNNSKPAYFNIYEILSNVQTELYNSIYTLQQNKTRNAELIRKIQSLDGLIKDKVLTTKTMMYNLIDDAFASLEHQLKESLAKLHEQIGLYSIKKSQKYQQNFNEMLAQLYSINDGLKSDKYLGNIIIFLKDKLQETLSFNNKVTSYLEANESYYPRVEVSNEAKNAIVSNFGRLIKIEKKQLDRKKQKQDTRSNIFRGPKPGKPDLNEKSEKIQRSYTPQKSASFMKTLTGDTSRTKIVNTNNSPYRQKAQLLYRQKLQPPSFRQKPQFGLRNYQPLTQLNYPYPSNAQPNRIRDFKQEFEMLSRKVSQMKKQNEMITKQFK